MSRMICYSSDLLRNGFCILWDIWDITLLDSKIHNGKIWRGVLLHPSRLNVLTKYNLYFRQVHTYLIENLPTFLSTLSLQPKQWSWWIAHKLRRSAHGRQKVETEGGMPPLFNGGENIISFVSPLSSSTRTQIVDTRLIPIAYFTTDSMKSN